MDIGLHELQLLLRHLSLDLLASFRTGFANLWIIIGTWVSSNVYLMRGQPSIEYHEYEHTGTSLDVFDKGRC
jgi:hypothetical protein